MAGQSVILSEVISFAEHDKKGAILRTTPIFRALAASGVLCLGLLTFSAIPAMAAPLSSGATAYTCSGGEVNFANPPASTYATDIPSGTYSTLTIAGVCEPAPNAVINVTGNINVATGGLFDAQGYPSTITVGHNVVASPGSILALGCLPNPVGHTTGHPCGTSFFGNTLNGVDPTTAASEITVNGNLTANSAYTVLLNGAAVNGNVTLTGGGGDAQGIEIPWAIKDNTISGNLVVSGVTANWLGVLLNSVGGNAVLTNITATDPGDAGRAVFIVRNSVGNNLNCSGIAPAVYGGFPGEFNSVGHNATGQCANLADEQPPPGP